MSVLVTFRGISTGPLRARLAASSNVALLAAEWKKAGFPDARDHDGNDVWFPADTYHDVLEFLSKYAGETTASHTSLVWVRARSLGDGYADIVEFARAVGVQSSTQLLSDGEVVMLGRAIDMVLADQADLPTVTLDTDPLPGGGPVDVRVAGPLDLALVPPKGTVGEVLQWVGGDPERARALLHHEQQRPKPRKGVVSKIVSIATEAAPATVEVPPEPDGPPNAVRAELVAMQDRISEILENL